MKKRVSLILRQNTEDGAGASWLGYMVKEVKNSTKWDIGEVLTKEDVDNIIGNKVNPVEVKIV